MRVLTCTALALAASVSMASAQTTEPIAKEAAGSEAAVGDAADEVKECRQMLQSVETQTRLAEMERLVIPSKDLRTIREAALAFARAGYEEGCEEVAEALQELLEERREELEDERDLQRVRNAVPVSQLPGSVMASTLVGSEVVNNDLNDLGTVEDLILTENQGRYALIKHGGFLGLGEDFTPIGLDRLRITEDRRYLVLDVDEDALDEAPEVSDDEVGDVANWSQSVDQWWTANVDQKPQPQ